jgi:hypothetical protein
MSLLGDGSENPGARNLRRGQNHASAESSLASMLPGPAPLCWPQSTPGPGPLARRHDRALARPTELKFQLHHFQMPRPIFSCHQQPGWIRHWSSPS